MKYSVRFLMRVALLLTACAPRAAAQTYLHHDRQVLTDSVPSSPRFGELCKDAMAVDNYRVVYSAGYQDFLPGSSPGPPFGRRGMVLVHAPSMAYIGKFVTSEPDSVYTGAAVKATGLEIWVVGTKNVSTTPEWFCERWKPVSGSPGTWSRTHVRYAGSVPGLAGGVSFGGSIQRYSMGQFLVSGSWTAGTMAGSGPSKLFARALNNSNLTPVWTPASTVSVISGPGRLGGLDGQSFAWGKDIFRWHPRALLSSMDDARFYLGGTISGDIVVNRFHRWDGGVSVSFNNGPPHTWATPVLPDLMTAMTGLKNSGVYITGVSRNPDQGFLYSWTRGTSSTSPGVPRAGAMPFWFGPQSGVYDVKVQTVGAITHAYAGGYSSPMGGGWVWQFDHTGPAGALAPSVATWPFLPYSAAPHPWLNTLPVYGLELLPASGGTVGDLYATGQHGLITGATGQIAMKVQYPGTPGPLLSWSGVPFPPSGTGRRVTGHTVRFAGSHVFSHGNGHTDNAGLQCDAEVMAFTP